MQSGILGEAMAHNGLMIARYANSDWLAAVKRLGVARTQNACWRQDMPLEDLD